MRLRLGFKDRVNVRVSVSVSVSVSVGVIVSISVRVGWFGPFFLFGPFFFCAFLLVFPLRIYHGSFFFCVFYNWSFILYLIIGPFFYDWIFRAN